MKAVMAALLHTHPEIDAARQRRIEIVEDTFATTRMEGLEPTPHAKRLFQEYIDGRKTLGEIGTILEVKHQTK